MDQKDLFRKQGWFLDLQMTQVPYLRVDSNLDPYFVWLAKFGSFLDFLQNWVEVDNFKNLGEIFDLYYTFHDLLNLSLQIQVWVVSWQYSWFPSKLG